MLRPGPESGNEGRSDEWEMEDNTVEAKRIKLAAAVRKRAREVEGVAGSSARRALDVSDRERQGSGVAKRGRCKRGRKAAGSQ